MRVADYIVSQLVESGITDVFMVTGGGAMYLNDAFGRQQKIKVTCFHHEQACAFAADSYYRLRGRPAALCVTTGPGATNAITGIFGAFVDSIAVVVISGQVRIETLVSNSGLPLRQLGDQEVDIVRMVAGITKYAALITRPDEVEVHLREALRCAVSGRPGPVWLDVPINIQGSPFSNGGLPELPRSGKSATNEHDGLDAEIAKILEYLRRSKRPVVYAGSGIRLSNQYQTFLRIIGALGVPVVTAWNSNDLVPDEHEAYAGRPGSIGNRAGNFAVQNSDLLLVLGCRLNIRLVSYNWRSFARHAYKIIVDIDPAELRKPTVNPDFPIQADLADFLPKLEAALVGWKKSHAAWLAWCKQRLLRYPVVLPEYRLNTSAVNPYVFVDELFSVLREDDIVVCGDGTACVAAFQAAKIKAGQRVFHNSGCAPMGYDLPAAIGAALAIPSAQRVVCLAGDGSIMMNLQELQTIKGNGYPIKIFILNNRGYHSIRQTQQNFFPDNIVGCGPDSGLSFPDFEKISNAFGFRFARCSDHRNLKTTIESLFASDDATICEVILDLSQQFAPKLSSRRNDDGQLVTSSLEDMSPFLSREELASNMIAEEKLGEHQ